MVSYFFLLVATWVFTLWFHSGLTNLAMIDYQDQWDAGRKNQVKGKALKSIWFFIIILLSLGYLGWILKGNWFLAWFAGIFIWNYIQEKRFIKKKIEIIQANNYDQ
jgi:hypothetical protein